MTDRNKDINALLDNIALMMNVKKEDVAKKLRVLDDEIIDVLNFSLLEKRNESEDEFIKVSPETLLAIKPVTHPNWEDAYSPQRFREVSNDANQGVTFAFYWKDGYLCWEY